MDVGNQRRIQQLFGLLPELIAAFSFALSVGDQRGDEFQDGATYPQIAFCGGERPLVRSQRPGYFKGFPVSMVKAKAGAYAPH